MRSDSLTLLRVVGCMGVVYVHSAPRFAFDVDPTSASWWAAAIFEALARPGSALFVMIAGALFVRHDEPSGGFIARRVARLLPAILAWTAIYAGWRVLGGQDPAVVIDGVSSGEPAYYHLWFIWMLPLLYLFVPLLRHARRRLSGGLPRYALLAALGIVTSAASALAAATSTPVPALLQAPFFVVFLWAGDLLHRDGARVGKHTPAVLLPLGVAGVLSAAILLKDPLGPMAPILAFSTRFFPEMVLTLLVFLLVEKAGRSAPMPRGVQELSGLCAGIYLVHPLLIDVVAEAGIAGDRPSIGRFLIVFAASAATVFALSHAEWIRPILLMPSRGRGRQAAEPNRAARYSARS